MTWGVFAVAEGSDVAVARVAPAGGFWGGGGRLEFRRDASLPWAGQRVALCPPGSAPTRCAQCVAPWWVSRFCGLVAPVLPLDPGHVFLDRADAPGDNGSL